MRSSQRNAPANALPESDSSTSRTNPRRRNFLLALGLGGAGAAALAARSLSGVAPDAARVDDDASGGAGYQESDHVRRYYRTAKI
jgi:hypothetical protein